MEHDKYELIVLVESRRATRRSKTQIDPLPSIHIVPYVSSATVLRDRPLLTEK